MTANGGHPVASNSVDVVDVDTSHSSPRLNGQYMPINRRGSSPVSKPISNGIPLADHHKIPNGATTASMSKGPYDPSSYSPTNRRFSSSAAEIAGLTQLHRFSNLPPFPASNSPDSASVPLLPPPCLSSSPTAGFSNDHTGHPAPTSTNATELPTSFSLNSTLSKTHIQVICHARARIPTPHGEVYLHLYKNNQDSKEHLAFVVDSEQMEDEGGNDEISRRRRKRFIRSKSLDSEWRKGETEMERIVRGAYTGRLKAPQGPAGDANGNASPAVFPSDRPFFGEDDGEEGEFTPPDQDVDVLQDGDDDGLSPPLVRIHSECLTGEILGSQRCDCGEQLDEAFRLMFTPSTTFPPYSFEEGFKPRGVVVYLRQEGRGIGLLEKLKAYNLQDLGHDTVTANLLLGHDADARSYDVAGAILRDLGLGEKGKGVRLLTNNPDKVTQAEKDGIKIYQRMPMVPRVWGGYDGHAGRRAAGGTDSAHPHSHQNGKVHNIEDPEEAFTIDDLSRDPRGKIDQNHRAYLLRRAGVGMIGAGTTKSPELEKYLRTKVERMGHMLELPTM